MNERLFKLLMAPRGEHEGGGGQGESTTDFSDPEADDAAAEAGAAETESETEEEQGEPQDLEEEEEVEEPLDRPAPKSFKDKHGNFDWKKISRVAGGDLEKSFKESQATITRFSQENKTLKEKASRLDDPGLQQRLANLEHLDQQYRTNPEVRQAINKALGITANGQAAAPELPKGVHPNDPLAPLIQNMLQQQQQMMGWRQQQEQQRQQQAQRDTFLQELRGANTAFKEQVGRDATEAEMTAVANKMRETGYLRGADFVPTLFLKEIREAATAKYQASRTNKRNLPSGRSTGARTPAKTQKGRSLRDNFDDAWQEAGLD